MMRSFCHAPVCAHGEREGAAIGVLDAFFDAGALAVWWRAARSSCTPRPLGTYEIEWATGEWHDETLGRLGGTLRGTVIEFREGKEFFVAEMFWLPPDGQQIGPMAFNVRCTALAPGSPSGPGVGQLLSSGPAVTMLHVAQSGWQDDRRWNRYYDVLAASLPVALEDLKTYLERR
jgi:hypothetical protein